MQKSFVIVIPSYNNARWFRKNLHSALSQDYPSYRIIYTDDKSPDNTGKLVEEFLSSHKKKHLVQLIRNENRKGALYNLYDMIHSCEDDEIVVTLDGDDWFYSSKVLSKLNDIYSNPNVWITYGQYRSFPDNRVGCSGKQPGHVIANAAYRTSQWRSSHLRTFYSWLFKQIRKEDLFYEGEFFPTAWDLPMMFPMLEMAGQRQKFISDILYIYNCENPINDSKVDLRKQQALERVARSMPKYPLLIQRP